MWPFKSKPDPALIALKADYEAAKLRMREPWDHKEGSAVNAVTAVCQVLRNEDGRLGIQVARGFRAWAIHEINQDHTFSKKGPYWTKKRWIGNPRRFAICQLAVSREPQGMKNPNEQIRHFGLSIVEMDTDSLPVMSFEDWRLAFQK